MDKYDIIEALSKLREEFQNYPHLYKFAEAIEALIDQIDEIEESY